MKLFELGLVMQYREGRRKLSKLRAPELIAKWFLGHLRWRQNGDIKIIVGYVIFFVPALQADAATL